MFFFRGSVFSLLLKYFLLHSAHLPCFTPDKLLFSCLPMCSGIVSMLLRSSLSPLPPPVHFLLVFELSQEFPLGQSWPPATFAWLPVHQNSLFCFKWLFLEISWPPRSLCLSSSGILPASSLHKCRSAVPKCKISILLPTYLASFRIFKWTWGLLQPRLWSTSTASTSSSSLMSSRLSRGCLS